MALWNPDQQMNDQPQQGGGAMSQQTNSAGGWKRPKFRTNQPPGNEPGGANGMYGRFGQMPSQQPSQGFRQQVDGMRRGFGRPPQMGGKQRGMGMEQPVEASQSSVNYGGGNPGYMGEMRSQAMAQPMPQVTQSQPDYSQASAMPSTPVPSVSATPQVTQAQPDSVSAQAAQQAPMQQQTATAQPQNSFASPFGNMRFGAPPAMADGGIVDKPTLAILGEDGPEAVVPMSGNPNAKITPGMMQSRDTFQTGPSSLGQPLHSLAPMDGPMAKKNWARFGA